MATDQVARGGGPEPTKFDKRRHEMMRLKRNGLYGIPKFLPMEQEKILPGTCLSCVYGEGEHICGQSKA